MEHQDSPERKKPQGNARPTTKQSHSAPHGAVHKRNRSAKETPGFADWVDAGANGAKPAKSTVEKAVELVTSPAVNLTAGSEISVRIEKPYKIRVAKSGGQTHVTGELHLVPWDRYTHTVTGLIAVVADLLNLPQEKIRTESDIPTRTDGTAYPAFVLIIPRVLTDDEQRALNVAFSAFRQRLRGQDESLTKDLFADANPEAAAAGRRAAEGVRRKIGGRALPQALTVQTGGPDAKPVKLEGRIGGHPDPEHDKDSVEMTGKVIDTLTEDHKIAIRCYQYQDEKGHPVSSDGGKKFVINYSDTQHKAEVLKLPLGLSTLVTFTVIPRLGRNKDRLMLKTIHRTLESPAAADSSNTTR